MSAVEGLVKGIRADSAPPRDAPPIGTILAAAVVALVLFASFFPSLLTPFEPDRADLAAVFQPPSWEHWFGTDQLGRDVFTRVVYGSGVSLLIGIGATAIALVFGILLGVLAVYTPFGLHRVFERLVDLLLAFPEILLALIVIAVLGKGPTNTLLAVGLAGIAAYARLIRSQLLQARLSGYAEHARIIGEPPLRILLRHVIPNTIRPLVILGTIGIANSILAASSLSFLGLGVEPPAAEWGALLAEGRSNLQVAPWASILPATVVAGSVISLMVLGRYLQRRFANQEQ
ncbi:ABC transporter permease [Gulosibacter sp. 10]|uniref:ABC transporter permease n=1 Tax=Gulosibacter sp. 10 TaxID=1255570 RepID=UPI00097F59FF|nr:ABC transporter permease [Gulosibacter sp. 10]SJM64244.1 COG1173: ABC-type dipeptide/oligopeptide/nickel transport systems, permease components [Gulosibacter sp. 10]